MLDYVLALILALSPRLPDHHARPFAAAIASATDARAEQRALVAIAFRETGFRFRGVPFGITCCHRRGMSLDEAARVALGVWRRAVRSCGARERAFGYYQSGACRPNAYGEAQARVLARLRRVRVSEVGRGPR